MKQIMIILIILIVILGVVYYSAFVREKKVTNEMLLGIHNQKNGIIISTHESSKYINDYEILLVNDSTASITIYTTSIYNLFAKKVSKIKINLDDKIEILEIEGKMIRRKSLTFDS